MADDPVVENASTSSEDLDSLRAQIEAEKTARADAERRATEAERRAGETDVRLRTESTARQTAEQEATEAALSAADQEATRLEGAYATALSEGKYAEAAKIQRQLVSAQTRVENLTSRKSELAQPVVPMEEAPEVRAKREFLEARTPKTRAWLEKHPQYFTDNKFQLLATAAHNEAVANGVAPDSDEYFEMVETKVGLRKPEEADGGEEAPVAPKAKTRVPAAAPSRGSPASGGGQRTMTYKPTDRELEACRISDPEGWQKDKEGTIKRYIENKMQLEKEGRLGPQYH